MIRLIGLLGAKGCGKDTLAKYLIARLGFVRASFADALYREVAQAYGVATSFLENRDTKETALPALALSKCQDAGFVEVALAVINKNRGLTGRLFGWALRSADLATPRSPRWVMQLWGTEYRRESKYGCDSYWLDKVRAVINANPDVRFVITDVRFMNEAKLVREYDGALVRVRRPILEEREAAARLSGKGTALHPSETQLASYPVDLEARNVEGNPDALLEGMQPLLPELSQAA